MTERFEFTVEEKESLYLLYAKLKRQIEVSLLPDDESRMCRHLEESVEKGQVHRDAFGHNPILFGFQTALIVVEEIGLKRDAVLAILLHPSVDGGFMTVDEVRTEFGESVARILHGLIRISELYAKNPVVES